MTLLERNVLRVSVFMAGALLMALEIAAFRIIGKTFGSALRETTTVISVFLAAMSVGYWVGGRAGDRWPDPRTLAATLFAAAFALLSVPWVDSQLSPQIARSALPLFAHAFFATTILFAVPTFLLAATSPIAIRLFTTSAGASGSTAGSISAISTVGSILGSIVTGFFLIDWLASIARTVLFVALGACITGLLVVLVALLRFQMTPVRRLGLATLSLLVLPIFAVPFLRSSTIDTSLLGQLPGTKILFAGDSPYHHMIVRDRGPYRELIFNIAIQTRMFRRDPSGPGLTYADAVHLGLMARPKTRRILLIGLGGGTIPKQILRFYPEATVDVVEIDALVDTVARRYFELPASDRLKVSISDGRLFLDRSDERWDMIIVDAYTTTRYGDTLPLHLTTQEFFEKVAAHLTEDGILHYHTAAFTSPRLVSALERTVRSIFPYAARTTGEIIASRTPFEVRQDALLAMAKDFPPAALPHFRNALLALHPVEPPPGALLTDDDAPVDTLLRK
jgi:spermidine synthase